MLKKLVTLGIESEDNRFQLGFLEPVLRLTTVYRANALFLRYQNKQILQNKTSAQFAADIQFHFDLPVKCETTFVKFVPLKLGSSFYAWF